jgi:putative addiction module killer protein
MEVQPNEISRYVTPEGRVPYDDWFYALRDNKIKNIINKRLNRVSLGNWGDYRSLGEGIFELRIDYGPGYRVYFGQVGATIVLLLIGGDKSTQEQDIRHAIKYWNNYRN